MSFRTCTPVTGLSHALALSVDAVDTRQRITQNQTLWKGGRPVTPGPCELAPLTVEPHPEAAAWGRNLEQFLALVHAPVHSPNPYNDHRFFAHAPVLSAGWADVPPGFDYRLAPGRADVSAGIFGPENTALVSRFERLLLVAGFDKRYPVLFDREGLILDGMHRMRACAKTDNRFYFLRLNF